MLPPLQRDQCVAPALLLPDIFLCTETLLCCVCLPTEYQEKTCHRINKDILRHPPTNFTHCTLNSRYNQMRGIDIKNPPGGSPCEKFRKGSRCLLLNLINPLSVRNDHLPKKIAEGFRSQLGRAKGFGI